MAQGLTEQMVSIEELSTPMSTAAPEAVKCPMMRLRAQLPPMGQRAQATRLRSRRKQLTRVRMVAQASELPGGHRSQRES